MLVLPPERKNTFMNAVIGGISLGIITSTIASMKYSPPIDKFFIVMILSIAISTGVIMFFTNKYLMFKHYSLSTSGINGVKHSMNVVYFDNEAVVEKGLLKIDYSGGVKRKITYNFTPIEKVKVESGMGVKLKQIDGSIVAVEGRNLFMIVPALRFQVNGEEYIIGAVDFRGSCKGVKKVVKHSEEVIEINILPTKNTLELKAKAHMPKLRGDLFIGNKEKSILITSLGGKSEGKLTLWKQDYPLLFVVYSSFFYTPDFGKLISEVLKFGKIAFIGSGVCRIVISTRRGKQLTKEEVPVVYEPAVPEALNKK